MAISKWKKTIGTVLQRVCIYETVNYNEDILIPYGWESMAPSPSKERKSVYDIRRLVYTTWQRNRIENSKLNEIDGISSAKRAFHRLCSSNRDWEREEGDPTISHSRMNETPKTKWVLFFASVENNKEKGNHPSPSFACCIITIYISSVRE